LLTERKVKECDGKVKECDGKVATVRRRTSPEKTMCEIKRYKVETVFLLNEENFPPLRKKEPKKEVLPP